MVRSGGGVGGYGPTDRDPYDGISRSYDQQTMSGGRSRAGGSGYSDTEDRYYNASGYDHSLRTTGRGVSYDSGQSMMPHPRGPAAGAGGQPHVARFEVGDSDLESVVSATSAFSSQSAPHARGRRQG